VRFVTAQETAHRVLYHEDIDLTKMNNLAKVEEEQHKNRYLSYAEQQKHRKSDGNFHYTPRLLLETTMMKKSLTETVLLSFTNLETQYAKVFSKRC
jgi:hypothetical protein